MSNNQGSRGLDALQEYQRAVAAGEIIRTKPKSLKEKWEENKTSLRCSVSAMCYDCMGGGKADSLTADIRGCTAHNCPLYLVRPYK